MSKVISCIKRFHKEDQGSNALEQVVIFAFGAVILGGAYYMWNSLDMGSSGEQKGILGMVGDAISSLFKISFSNNSSNG